MKRFLVYFRKSGKHKLQMPYIDVLVDDYLQAESCLVDTGAALCIFGKNLEGVFKGKEIIDTFEVQYGSGKVKLNVYFVKLTIKGYEFESKVAFDPNKSDSYLGHLDFFDRHFDTIIFQFHPIEHTKQSLVY